MWNCLGWVIAAIAVTAVLLIYDPNVPLDAEDYWILLLMEKMVKFARLKRFFLGGNVIEGKIMNFPFNSSDVYVDYISWLSASLHHDLLQEAICLIKFPLPTPPSTITRHDLTTSTSEFTTPFPVVTKKGQRVLY